MPIEFNCPNCRTPYLVPDDRAGERAECRQCGEPLTVPRPNAESPPVGGPYSDDHEAIVEHFERRFGRVSGTFRNLGRDPMQLEIQRLRPEPQSDWSMLFTTGCSDRPLQHLPEGHPHWFPHVELLLQLDSGWPLDRDHLADEQWAWPLGLLRQLAHLPHEIEAWLGPWQTIPNGDPPKPYTTHAPFAAVTLMPPPDGIDDLVLGPTKSVKFLQVFPLYAEEAELVRVHGLVELRKRLTRHGIPPYIQVERQNLAARRFGWF